MTTPGWALELSRRRPLGRRRAGATPERAAAARPRRRRSCAGTRRRRPPPPARRRPPGAAVRAALLLNPASVSRPACPRERSLDALALPARAGRRRPARAKARQGGGRGPHHRDGRRVRDEPRHGSPCGARVRRPGMRGGRRPAGSLAHPAAGISVSAFAHGEIYSLHGCCCCRQRLAPGGVAWIVIGVRRGSKRSRAVAYREVFAG